MPCLCDMKKCQLLPSAKTDRFLCRSDIPEDERRLFSHRHTKRSKELESCDRRIWAHTKPGSIPMTR